MNTEALKQKKEKYSKNLSKLDVNSWEETRESMTKTGEGLGNPAGGGMKNVMMLLTESFKPTRGGTIRRLRRDRKNLEKKGREQPKS